MTGRRRARSRAATELSSASSGRLEFRLATIADVAALLKLRLAVDADQAERFGDRRWSTTVNEASVARGLKSSRTVVATRGGHIVAAARLETKKPWAIDLDYFTPARNAIYLHDVNVEPRLHGSGVGRELMEHVKKVATEWPVASIRIDTYDGESGAAAFYQKCGFTEVGRKIYRRVPLVYLELVLHEATAK